MGRFKSEEVTVVAPVPTKAAEPPKEGRGAHLIVLSGANVGQVFDLAKKKVQIGRDESVEIQIMDAGISRHHACISRDAGTYLLQDMGSRNGTFANNRRVEGTHPLADGDKVQIGVMTILKFTFDDAPEADYAHAMYEAALRDGLTGIFNRRYFEERLRSEFSFAARHGTGLALLFLDLDHFKLVNDTYGHSAGDRVLQTLADMLQRQVRSADIVCRYGGEEFAVLMPDTVTDHAVSRAEELRKAALALELPGPASAGQLSMSVGVATYPVHGRRAADLVRASDAALYAAKRHGRNRVETPPQQEPVAAS